MPASPDDLFAYLDSLGITHQTVTHAPVFTVEAVVEGYQPAQASGRSRQEAEKAAAQALLKREGAT